MMNGPKRLFAIAILLAFVASAAFAQSALKSGEYLGRGEDVQGSCTIKVTIAGGRFTALEVVEGLEALGMDAETLKGFLDALIAKQELESVDVVTGATMGCDLIKKALFMALKQAR